MDNFPVQLCIATIKDCFIKLVTFPNYIFLNTNFEVCPISLKMDIAK